MVRRGRGGHFCSTFTHDSISKNTNMKFNVGIILIINQDSVIQHLNGRKIISSCIGSSLRNGAGNRNFYLLMNIVTGFMHMHNRMRLFVAGNIAKHYIARHTREYESISIKLHCAIWLLIIHEIIGMRSNFSNFLNNQVTTILIIATSISRTLLHTPGRCKYSSTYE